MTLKVVYTDKENWFTIEQKTETEEYVVAVPVSNGVADYAEFYEISDDEYQRFLSNKEELLEFVRKCRAHEEDKRLLLKTGSNRGTPI